MDEGLFFGGMALVTFGGAYAVLSYVAQAAVETYGWLSAWEMVRGLALAETTPGPLIMVVQFVAFLGAYRDPGDLDPLLAGVLGALLAAWVTFVPCFVFIFLGAPYVDGCAATARCAALEGVTAAMVGVIANLALFFAVHTLFSDTRLRPGSGFLRAPGVVLVHLGGVAGRGRRHGARVPAPVVGAEDPWPVPARSRARRSSPVRRE